MTNPCIKLLDLCDTILTKNLFFFGNFAVPSPQVDWKGFSKLNDKLTMSFFYNQIGQDLLTKVKQSMSCDNPFIAVSFKKVISCFLERCRTSSFKRFLKPMEESYVGIGNLKNASVMTVLVSISRFVFKLAGMKTTLSVNDSSQVGQVNGIMDFWFIKNSMFVINVIELHIPPTVQVH